MNRVSIPAVFLVATVLAVILLLIGYMPLEADRQRGHKATNSQMTDWRPAPTEYPGEKGRWVVMLGDVEMRIPRDRRTQTPASTYDLYPEALCLREHEELADCFQLHERIRIFLMSQPLDWPPPACNMNRDYSDEFPDGPIATANATVELFRSSSRASRKYVYRMPGASCWHPVATCGPLRCVTSFHVMPGVSARYQFAEDSIENWPANHQRVLDHVMPLVAWE